MAVVAMKMYTVVSGVLKRRGRADIGTPPVTSTSAKFSDTFAAKF